MANTRKPMTGDRKVAIANALETAMIDAGFQLVHGYGGLEVRDTLNDSAFHDLFISANTKEFFETLVVDVGEVSE